MSNSSPWTRDSKGRLYKLVEDRYGETFPQYKDDVRERSSSSRQTPQSRQTHKSDNRRSQNTSAYIVDAESKSQPSWDRKGRVPEATSRRGESNSKYGSGQSQGASREGASTSGYKDPSYDEQGGVYNEPREEPPYQPTSYESSSYTFKPVSNDRSSDDHNAQTRDWTRSSAAGDPLIPAMGALSIAHGDSRAPISSSVPIRSDVSYIPNSIPDIIPEDSRSHSQWTSSSARNEQSMHSNLYQVSGQRPAGISRKPKGRFIAGTNGHAEELDPSYKVRRYDYQKFFRPGRVFSTLWTDAFAASTNDSEKDASTSVTYVILGERVHSKIRRFVVVRQAKDLKSCTCVSITTYMGQGVKKRGINLDEHGLIYSSGKAPRSEKGIEKQALKVRLSEDGEELTSPSLVNYGRIYTLECNVKVKDVGELDTASRRLLKQYFRAVINDTDDYDGETLHLPSQATDNTLAGVGGAGAMAPQNYGSPRATDFVSSGNNYSSSGTQYGGYSGYNRDQNLASWSQERNPSTTSDAQSSYNSQGGYGAHQSFNDGYNSATGSSAYTRNNHVAFNSSSATANLVPHVSYTDQTLPRTSSMYSSAGTGPLVPQAYDSRVPRSYPTDSSLPEERYTDNAAYGSRSSFAPTLSGGGGADYTSSYASADNRGDDNIDLDDNYDSRQRRDSGSSRTVRPSAGKKHWHRS